jgi:hypothetical protein
VHLPAALHAATMIPLPRTPPGATCSVVLPHGMIITDIVLIIAPPLLVTGAGRARREAASCTPGACIHSAAARSGGEAAALCSGGCSYPRIPQADCWDRTMRSVSRLERINSQPGTVKQAAAATSISACTALSRNPGTGRSLGMHACTHTSTSRSVLHAAGCYSVTCGQYFYPYPPAPACGLKLHSCQDVHQPAWSALTAAVHPRCACRLLPQACSTSWGSSCRSPCPAQRGRCCSARLGVAALLRNQRQTRQQRPQHQTPMMWWLRGLRLTQQRRTRLVKQPRLWSRRLWSWSKKAGKSPLRQWGGQDVQQTCCKHSYAPLRSCLGCTPERVAGFQRAACITSAWWPHAGRGVCGGRQGNQATSQIAFHATHS